MPVVRKLAPSDAKILRETYFNAQHPASLGGVERLAEATPQIHPQDVQNWLRQQWTYTLHKPLRHNFKRRRYVVRGINAQWQADLVEMQQYSRENKGYRYILCAIDIFSRYAYARPLKTKSGPDVAEAFEDIFTNEEGVTPPKLLQTDLGKEFYNQHVAKVLEKYNIELFSVYSEKKAAIVERFQRTLQERMYRAFTYQGNHQWLDLLPKVIDAYNNSYHRTIKTMPSRVNKTNETDVWLKQYGNLQTNAKAKYSVGDLVRIPKHRTVFSKGYIEKWTDEEFIISKVNTKYTPAMYTLTDEMGEEIKGSFYEFELQKIDNPDKLYRIERIIRTKTMNNKKYALVKWKGYKNPSWVERSTINPV